MAASASFQHENISMVPSALRGNFNKSNDGSIERVAVDSKSLEDLRTMVVLG
jgi:hypothetical protein